MPFLRSSSFLPHRIGRSRRGYVGPRRSLLFRSLLNLALTTRAHLTGFLIVWQENRFGRSSLEPRIPKGLGWKEQLNRTFRAPMMGIHYALIGANAIIISGSSILASSLNTNKPDDPQKADKGKALRSSRCFSLLLPPTTSLTYSLTLQSGIAGTAIFLALVQVFAAVAIAEYRKKGDRTLLLILGTWPLLTVRGIYGILAVLINAFSCTLYPFLFVSEPSRLLGAVRPSRC
jgi:hypothetical protein